MKRNAKSYHRRDHRPPLGWEFIEDIRSTESNKSQPQHEKTMIENLRSRVQSLFTGTNNKNP
jgi:hypothetical protein